MSLLKGLFKQTAIYGLSSIVGRLLNFLLVPLYVSLFPTYEYGKVTDLYALAVFLAIVLTYGVETAYFRHVEKDPTERRSLIPASYPFWSPPCSFYSLFFLISNPSDRRFVTKIIKSICCTSLESSRWMRQLPFLLPVFGQRTRPFDSLSFVLRSLA